jgi:YVTN family beta-propeller protein
LHLLQLFSMLAASLNPIGQLAMKACLPMSFFLRAKMRLGRSILLSLVVLSLAPAGLAEGLNQTNPPSNNSLPKNTIQATILLGAGVRPGTIVISPNSQTIYVGSWSSNGSAVSVIDSQTNTVTATIPITGLPGDLAIAPDGSTLYLLAGVNSSTAVYAISTATDMVTATFQVPAGCFTVSPDGKHIYVTGYPGRGISIIDTATNQVHRNAIHTPHFLSREIVLSPDGQTAYVAGGSVALGTGALVIDLATRTITGTISIPTDFGPGLTVGPNGNLLYFNYGRGNAEALEQEILKIVATSTNQVTKRIALTKQGTTESFGNVGITPDGKYLYAAVNLNGSTSTLLMVEPHINKVVDSITLAQDSTISTVAIAPTAPFACVIGNVGNNDEGELFIIDISPK